MIVEAPATPDTPPLSGETRAAFARLIHDQCGLRLSHHQLSQLDGVAARVASAEGVHDAAALLLALRSGGRQDLLEQLAAHFAIGETHFFRVEPQVLALRTTVLPDLIARAPSRPRLRIWSAGCSTGEEPYTLAILLREQASDFAARDVEILGTDLNPDALAAAREASYGEWSFRGTPDGVRRRYFQPDGRRWRLHDAIRDMVTFRQLNLAADVFPAWASSPDVDLILCRNVTIYFGPDATARLYRRLADTLAPGGWLVLGPSDPTPDASSGLAPVCVSGAVLWRRECDVPAARPRREAEPPGTVGRGATRRPPTPGGQPRHDRRPVIGSPEQRNVHPAAGARNPAPLAAGARAIDAELRPFPTDQPLDPQDHLVLGLAHLEAGRIDLAVSCLRSATFLRSEHTVSQLALGRAYLLHGDPNRAVPALLHARRLLAAQPDDELVPESDGLRAAELRGAVDALLAAAHMRAEGRGT